MKLLLSLFSLLCISISSHAQIITTIAGTGTASYTGDGGAATTATLNEPSTLAWDAAGNMYISDWANSAVRKITPAGIISTAAGNGTPGYFGDGGQATAAFINHPHGIAFDRAGNMYISDEFNNRIRKVTPAGIISTVAGTGTPGYFGDGGQATAANINQPQGIAVDTSGNIYISDAINYRIRKVDPAGVITTFAGTGTSGFSGDGGQATAALLQATDGLTVDSSGNLFICDYMNAVIRKVDAAGNIHTVVGVGGTSGYYGDGLSATLAHLDFPVSIVFDGHGNLYIADQLNERIRMVNTAGIITTVAGSGMAGWGGDGGPATGAKFNSPVGVLTSNIGDLYIADADNYRVRKVACVTTPYVSIISGPDTVCNTGTITLSEGVTGGSWAAANAHASISSGGVVTGASPGLDTFTYTLAGACASTTMSKVVYVSHCSTLLVNGNSTGSDDMTLYPNPAANSLYIGNIQSAGNYAITNMVGAVMLSGALTEGENLVDISHLPGGVYLVKVNNSVTRKFVKL